MNQLDSGQNISRQLIGWSILSIISGLSMLNSQKHLLRGVGTQSIIWGAVDGLIGLIGWKYSTINHHKQEKQASEVGTDIQQEKLVRILRVNILLDIMYILGGVNLIRTKGKTDQIWLGHGLGIIIQGLFLFLFDNYHSQRLSR